MILGTLLVGIVAAHRRHTQQIRTAKEKHDAIVAADKLLGQWREQGMWGPAATSGRFPDRDDLAWKWSISTTAELSRMGGAIGRLEVFSTARPDESLAQVELVTTAGGTIQAAVPTASP
jgi:hypothetical protein